MASQTEVGETYNPMDGVFQAMLGDYADITNSLPGDYGAVSIENLRLAQKAKHEKYYKELGLFPGATLLDIGCGWGPFLNFCRKKGVETLGITLSTAQYNYLKKRGFDVELCSWQDFDPGERKFDAVSALGSIEHFATPKEFDEGKQPEVYRKLFEKVFSVLKENGRFGGQFMTWNGNVPKTSDMNPNAPKGSKEYHLGLLERFYPGSWLPSDFDSFYSSGKDLFETIEVIDGRVNYIWTMKCWGKQFRKPLPLIKWWYVLLLIPRIIFNRDFRLWSKAFWEKSNQLCFEKGWMGHQFFFLKKKN